MTAPSRLAICCKMLRNAGWLDHPNLPDQRPSESAIDWMVRQGLADTPLHAAEALLAGRGITPQLVDELLAELTKTNAEHDS